MGVEPQPVVRDAPQESTPASAADTTAKRAAALTDQPMVSDASMHAEPPAEPIVTPPANQPYATDYGSPSEGSGMRPGGESMRSAPIDGDAGGANVYEMRAPVESAAGPDDLTILEGIGPRVKEVLAEAGITTFAQLAAADVNRLREILEGANLRFLDPGTWAEQARMAAEGRMDDLQAFTDSLRGGRRVGEG
jgi:hypothetical protein